MKTIHADDQDIQQFIFDFDNCNMQTISHIRSCNICMALAKEYSVLLKDLGAQEDPVFKFNLEERVLKQINSQIQQTQRTKGFDFIAPIVLIVLGIAAILLSTSMTELNESSLTKDSPTTFTICLGLLIAAFLCIDVVRKFKMKMRQINFS